MAANEDDQRYEDSTASPSFGSSDPLSDSTGWASSATAASFVERTPRRRAPDPALPPVPEPTPDRTRPAEPPTQAPPPARPTPPASRMPAPPGPGTTRGTGPQRLPAAGRRIDPPPMTRQGQVPPQGPAPRYAPPPQGPAPRYGPPQGPAQRYGPPQGPTRQGPPPRRPPSGPPPKAPQKAAPQKAAPQKTAPQKAAPQRPVPRKNAPQKAAPQKTQGTRPGVPTDPLDMLTRRSNKQARTKPSKKERPLREPRTPSMRRFPQPGQRPEPPAVQPRRRRRTRAPREEPAGSLPQIASRRPRPWIPILLFTLIFLAMVYGCAKSMDDHKKSAPAPTVVWSAENPFFSAENQGVPGLAQGSQQLF